MFNKFVLTNKLRTGHDEIVNCALINVPAR